MKSVAESRQEPVPRPRVLLAEDDVEMRHLLARSFRESGFDVTAVSDGVALVAHLWDGFDLVVSDMRMPGLSGLQILDGGSGVEGLPPFILLTAYGSEATRERATHLGVVAVFEKPFEVEDLLATARQTVSRSCRPCAPIHSGAIRGAEQ